MTRYIFDRPTVVSHRTGGQSLYSKVQASSTGFRMMATFFYFSDFFSDFPTFFPTFRLFRTLVPLPRAPPPIPRSFIIRGYVHPPPSDEVRRGP